MIARRARRCDRQRHLGLLLELVNHDDCTHCAVDNLIRPTRRIAGQEDYRVGQKKRNTAPIPDAEAVRGVTNMMSRTGASILCVPALGESAETLKDIFIKHLGQDDLWRHCQSMNIARHEGRADSAPAMLAD